MRVTNEDSDQTAGVRYYRPHNLTPPLNCNIYPTKKKRNSKIFPLSFPFNAKMLNVIKYLVLIKSRQNSSVALMSIFAFHV